MSYEKIRISLGAIVMAGLATACGGESANAPPQTAANQTTTTAATQNDPPSLTMAGPGAPANGYPNASTDNGPGSTPPRTASPLDSTPGTTPIAGASSPAPAGGDAQSVTLGDGEIVAVVQAADHGEIDQAREAVRKGKNAKVKQFAQHMITDHSAAETKLASLDSRAGILPKENAVTAQLKSGGDQIMGNLHASSGSDFDKAYIDAQVSEHTQVLDLLDNKLIPQAQNSDLTKTLQDIRTKVAGHLKMAQEIQASLK